MEPEDRKTLVRHVREQSTVIPLERLRASAMCARRAAKTLSMVGDRRTLLGSAVRPSEARQFDVLSGVTGGDAIAPTLFNLL